MHMHTKNVCIYIYMYMEIKCITFAAHSVELHFQLLWNSIHTNAHTGIGVVLCVLLNSSFMYYMYVHVHCTCISWSGSEVWIELHIGTHKAIGALLIQLL